MSFSAAAENILKNAMAEGSKQVVLLVEHSAYSAEDMGGVITDIYRENPTIVPVEPMAGVNMYSGSGTQRLYEISINYGLTEEEINARSAQLMAVDVFAGLDMENLSETQRAYHCWNIVKIDGNYYHVDISEAMSGAIEDYFLKNDEGFWGQYRWDVASYPKCTEEMGYIEYLI